MSVDDLKWKKFPVLDDGFVCLVDVMGCDQSIVQAARVSFGNDQREDEKKEEERDRNLIRYLMRHRHTTPFEMCELKFLVRVPMDCWRQWIRHRTANVNEYSTRYTEAIDSQQKTGPEEWRSQSTTNKQGSGESPIKWPPLGDYGSIEGMSPEEYLTGEEESFHGKAKRLYHERLQFGVAREQARKDLPLSTYTEAYWKIDLHNLLHFLGLRMDSHAQKEIRDYATVIGQQITKVLFPITWEAFEDYRLNAMFLTAGEIAFIREQLFMTPSYCSSGINETIDSKYDAGQREKDELLNKLKRLSQNF